jgi:hypothetical protein
MHPSSAARLALPCPMLGNGGSDVDETLAVLAATCLAVSIFPASAGGLLHDALSIGQDNSAPVHVNVEDVGSASGVIGGGNGADLNIDLANHVGDVSGINLDTDFNNGFDATTDIGKHQFADVSAGGGDGVDANLDLGLDRLGAGGGLTGLGDVAGIGDLGLTGADDLGLGNVGFNDGDVIDLNGAAGTGDLLDGDLISALGVDLDLLDASAEGNGDLGLNL